MSIRVMLVSVLLVFALASAAQAGVVYVWSGSVGEPDGAGWDTAYHTIQQGIDPASAGDQVWVAAGTYLERVTLKDGVALYGGFPAGGGAWESRDASANQTIIDGGQGGSVVAVPADASSSTIVDGFVIQNGRAASGGGIYCGAGAQPVISNNTIRQNTATSNGGGIYGGGIITGNLITANTCGSSGGGIFCATAAASITGNTISENRAGWGGGIRFHASIGEITANRILRNVATSGAGGVNINSASPLVANNVFADNQTPNTAGGLDVNNSSSIVANNTLAGNSANLGGGIAVRGTGTPEFHNNIVAFNSSGFYGSYTGKPVLGHNNVYLNSTNGVVSNYVGIAAGATDVSIDPELADRARGDYHISVASPCRDRGDDAWAQSGWSDMDGQPRIFPPQVDIGADEVHQHGTLSDAKRQTNGSWITAMDVVVTAVWPDHFYVETTDRTCGMRVELDGHGVSVGQKVVVSGRMSVTAGMERCIIGVGMLVTGLGTAEPVGLPNRALGGSRWGPNPPEGVGQAGIWGSCGLNNVGLLVRTWGRVIGRGRDWFYMDDGSGVSDGTPYSGIFVDATGLTVPREGDWVDVTGVSSCDSFGGHVVNVLLPRTDSDVVVVSKIVGDMYPRRKFRGL